MSETRATQRRWGVGLLIGAPLSVPLVWLLLNLWIRILASIDPVPNQGAMLLAFLMLRGWTLVAGALFVLGAWLLWKSR